jgi:single-strand DNA-binding protein
MQELKMPELNSVLIAGNLTRDPLYRRTTNGTPVVNFSIAANRKYRDALNKWQEEVCYVGIVAWNKLAESCKDRLKKGSPVLIEGELQSHSFKTDDGKSRSIVEIKARRIQFLCKSITAVPPGEDIQTVEAEEPSVVEDDSFDKFLSNDELRLLNNDQHSDNQNQQQGE